MRNSVSVEQHLDRVLRWLPRTESETVSLAVACERTTAKDIRATFDLPPWDNSAMDGYAVRAEDTKGAVTDSPLKLTVKEEVRAGAAASVTLSPGEAAAITTGAPIPQGATAVVPIEDVLGFDPARPSAGAEAPDSICVTTPASRGRHIRRRGEDIQTSDIVLTAGTRLLAHHIGAAAAVGAAEVIVSARPRVAVIATGDELVEPGTALTHGKIPDSNSHLVANQVRAAGGDVVLRTRVSDDPDQLRRVLAETAEYTDAVVLTGGASVGAHDVSRLVLAPLSPAGGSPTAHHPSHHGPDVSFVQVQMQPGKPQGFGLLEDGRPAWILPGNPVSVLVSTALFVNPGIAAMQGRTNHRPVWRETSVATMWTSRPGRTQYIPVRLETSGGREFVRPAHDRGSGSHLAARLGLATGLVKVGAETVEVHPGDSVMFLDLSRP